MSGAPPDYVEVNERIVEWRDKYPDGSLQSEVVPSPVDGFVIVKAYAYRTPDDPRPGTGLAWEPVPGKTNFTRDSELMNAETSAWGRALIAVGAADAKRGIASANEVRGRQGDAPSSSGGATENQIAAIKRMLDKLPPEQQQQERNALEALGPPGSLSKRDASQTIDRLKALVPF